MNEQAIISTVDNLQRTFSIIIALALSEAFKQFVAEDKKDGKIVDKGVHWDRLSSLITFMILIFPFYQGMDRYMYAVHHQNPRPERYSHALAVDCVMITAVSFFFFYLSRALSNSHWIRFYESLAILLIIDGIWSFGILLLRDNKPTPIESWVWLDFLSVAAILAALWQLRKSCVPREKPKDQTSALDSPATKKNEKDQTWIPTLVLLILMVVRTGLDYYLNWNFYFPSPN